MFGLTTDKLLANTESSLIKKNVFDNSVCAIVYVCMLLMCAQDHALSDIGLLALYPHLQRLNLASNNLTGLIRVVLIIGA